MVIAGTVVGELEARDLIIGAGGHCQGFVRAETVSVEGKFTGILEAESLNIGEAGIVAGEITTDALAVDSGADISGTLIRKSPLEKQKA